MTKLSVNINKIATLRNARGHNNPDVIDWAKKIIKYGADGITVHPRPDERHIRKSDVYALKKEVDAELNIEGYPSDEFCKMVLKIQPYQVTLVPDKPDQITSDHGWDTIQNLEFLKSIIPQFTKAGIHVSLFLDPDPNLVESAKKTGADGIELYTEAYASGYHQNRIEAIEAYKRTAILAQSMGLKINAGHDLDLNNTGFLISEIPYLNEVSIGHALICDALIMGMEETVKNYLKAIKQN